MVRNEALAEVAAPAAEVDANRYFAAPSLHATPPPLPESETPVSSRFSEAHAALEKLQSKRARGWMSLALLLGSLVAFGGFGAWQWSWRTALLIGAILFVHELGHYAAMRFFGYRDLRMFFIPLLGAAVSGQNRNVPGWKQAVVSLMGPVPGVVIGTIVGVIASWNGNDAVALAALATIALNALNLLPFLPLDGGWIMNAVLFCRNRWLGAGFRLLAALAGFGATAAGFGKLWMYLGIATLCTIPGLLMEGRVIARLRAGGWQPAAQGNDRLEGVRADQIFAAYDHVTAGKLTPKSLATASLGAFEKLNAHPPGVLASAALLFTYFGTLVVAVIGIVFCSLYLHGGGIFPEESVTSAEVPANVPVTTADIPLEPSASHHFVPAGGPQSDRARVVVSVLRFPSEALGTTAFQALQAESPVAAFSQFGDSLSISADPEDRQVLATVSGILDRAGAVPSTRIESAMVAYDLLCEGPDEPTAEALEHAIDLSLSLPDGLRPSAPWVDGPWQESTRHAAATYLLARDTRFRASQSEHQSAEERKWRLRALLSIGTSARLEAARRQAEVGSAAIARLSEEGGEELHNAALAMALQEPQIFVGSSATDYFEAMPKWEAEMRDLITRDEAVKDRGTAATGRISRQGRTLILRDLMDPNDPATLPLIARFLEQHGCSDFRYAVRDESAYAE